MPSNTPPNEYAPVQWGGPTEYAFTCPSGQKCRMKDLGIEEMAAIGIMDQLDTIGVLVQEKHIERTQGKKPQDRKAKKPTRAQQAAQEQADVVSWMRDPQKFLAIGTMLNKVTAACVLEPVIENPYVPVDENDPSKGERKRTSAERLEGAIYADSVAFADKMAIFQRAWKGVAELEDFREGPGEDVESVEDVAEPGKDA